VLRGRGAFSRPGNNFSRARKGHPLSPHLHIPESRAGQQNPGREKWTLYFYLLQFGPPFIICLGYMIWLPKWGRIEVKFDTHALCDMRNWCAWFLTIFVNYIWDPELLFVAFGSLYAQYVWKCTVLRIVDGFWCSMVWNAHDVIWNDWDVFDGAWKLCFYMIFELNRQFLIRKGTLCF
jgi:hypothetical protein